MRHVRVLAGLCLLGLMMQPAAAHEAHQHGVARLDVALDGAVVSVGLEMPLDSLVGFERAPRTDAERRSMSDALARLHDGGALFDFDRSAGCVLSSADVRTPVLEPAAGTGPAGGEHADLDADYVFRCERPDRLTALQVRLFDAFRRLQRIDAQVASPAGQRRHALNRDSRSIPLAR